MSIHNKVRDMPTIFARQALLPDGWRTDVRVTVDGGRIATVTVGAKPVQSDAQVDTLLPAVPNLHSHTFQRAMAGMTERRGSSADSFWTWRDLMYRFVTHLTPADVEAIAAFAFMEMQEQGFGACAEFHYLHHGRDGSPYASASEMSQRIMAAADATGIGLTLLPVLYSYGGLNGEALAGGQLRFGNGFDAYARLHGDAALAMRKTLPDDAVMGVAPHSLRAVSVADLKRLGEIGGDGPIHIHIAEQVKEVDDVVAAHGARPVAWLLQNVDVTRGWCLVHATHMTETEVLDVARSGAVAGLCPVTEANLGDGIFDGAAFLAAGGVFGVGTDSNVRISVSGELSLLEYSQRLKQRQRNVLAGGEGSTGLALYKGACAGGAQALGRDCGAIAVGMWADLVAIDAGAPAFAALRPEQFVDGWIFAGGDGVVTDLWSAGRHCVRDGQHIRRDMIAERYRETVKRLVAVL